MAPVVTVGQVRNYLSSPPWSAEQEASCALLISQRQRDLENYFSCPIDPRDRIENVAMLDSGLLATTWPVFRVYAIDTTTVTGPGAVYGEALPSPYVWRDEGWVSAPEPALALANTTRPYSLLSGDTFAPKVAMSYAGGWGGQPDIVGAIIQKVAAVMLNRHDDTVTVRGLDAKPPPPLKEEWTDAELKRLSYRRRLRGGHRR